MSDTKVLKGIDVLKLFCAFLIVLLHTYNRDGGILGNWFYNEFTPIAVPFFFIVSGFFFSKGMIRMEWSKDYLKRYMSRIIKMYVAWTLITLPVSWLCIVKGHGDYSFALKAVYLFRMLFFSGSCGIYWYILAMICSCPIIYFFMKKGWGVILYIFATLLFAVGAWYNSPYNNNNIAFQIIHAVFGSERNFFNVGLFYMCIGQFLANHEHVLKIKNVYIYASLILSVILRTLEVYELQTNLLQALIAVIVFTMAWNMNLEINDEKSLMIRKLSTAMYLLHYPFILLFDFYLKRGTIIDYPAALCFCFIVFYIMIKYLPVKWQKVLLG